MGKLLAALLPLLPLTTVGGGRPDVVLEWTALMLNAIRADNTGPTLSTRNLALLHTAIYDAVNSIEGTHQPYLSNLLPPAGALAEGAAAGAAYEVLSTLYPTFQARANELYLTWVASSTRSAAVTNSLNFGGEIARIALQSRSFDGSTTLEPYIPNDLPGQWRRTPPFFRPPQDPQWGDVIPFCLPESESYVPGPPPALDSPEYAIALNEVKLIGARNSSIRSAEQGQIAVFWSDFSYTSMPPGHWHEITTQIVRDQNLDLSDTARLFALISLAQADAAIVCWKTKFRYNFWRPITAIQRADEDGNTATDADPTWEQFLNAPPFPGYTSGHSTFSKASATVLSRFFRTDAVSFTASSDSLPGVFRSFESFSACADEVGISRIYGGFHFQFDNLEGKKCGQKIAEFVSGNFLLANHELPLIRFEKFVNGAALLRLHGHIGAACVLEQSDDFKSWLAISTNIAAVGGTSVIERESGSSHRFYRLKE